MTPYYMAHLGGVIQRGPALAFIEATAITKYGRVSPNDVSIWCDDQIAPMTSLTEWAHSQNQKVGIQLAHGGRKSSTVAPWLAAVELATPSVGGFPDEVVGPSSTLPYHGLAKVHQLTIPEIEDIKQAWVDAAHRSIKAGFDVIEIHAAHGYLLSSFHSPATNDRTDQYGGSFENRTRLTREIVSLVRAAIPDTMPLFMRISATDWLDHDKESFPESWTVDDTVRFAPILADLGIDLLDISSGGNHWLQKIKGGPAYQAGFAKAVKEAVGDRMCVSAVGSITNGKQANEVIEGVDVIMAGRPFQKNPGLVWSWADDLGIKIQLPGQIRWGFEGRRLKDRGGATVPTSL